MWRNDDEQHDSDCDDGEEIGIEETFKPTFIVIAIDTHPSMFAKSDTGTIPFRSCLEACHSLADSLIFRQDKRSWSPFAIVLAREQFEFIDFQSNVLATVKLLKTKLKLSDKELSEEFQRKGEFDLAGFLLSCKKLFHDIKSSFLKRNLIYITNDDEPVKTDPNKFTVLNEIKTFAGSQIGFQIIPMRESFNYKLFYNELFSLLDPSSIEEICTDAEGLAEKLLMAIVMKLIRKKMYFYPFKDDPTRYIKCFTTDLAHNPRILNVPMTKDGKKVKSNPELDDQAPSYSFKCQFADRSQGITFDSSEIDSLMDFSFPTGYTLLYISKRLVNIGYVISNTRVLEQDTKEESPYFKNFWQYCLDKDRVLICAAKSQQPCKLRYTELSPTQINGSSMFLCKRIPFANEIMYPLKQPYAEFEENEEKRKAVQDLVDKLTFDFNFKMIPDPCYRLKKAYVKAKLLDEEMENITDITFNKESLDEHLNNVIEVINSTFNLAEQKKRKAPAVKSGSSSKKKK